MRTTQVTSPIVMKAMEEAFRDAKQKYNELIQKNHNPEGTLSILGRDPRLNNSPDALGESNANIQSPKDYWPATASSSGLSAFFEDSENKLPEPSISCEDSDNQRLAAPPLTSQDGKGKEIVLQEANQSPNIKLEGTPIPCHHTPVPKLSLESINLNSKLKKSNETYANSSQPSLLFRALETSRQLHNLPKKFFPLEKFQFSAVEPEKNFSTKNCLVSSNIEEPYRVVISPLREQLGIEKLPVSCHFSNKSSTTALTNFDSTVTGDDPSTLPFLLSIGSSNSDEIPSLSCDLKNTENSINLKDHQGDDTQPDSPSQPPVNHLELHQVFAAHNLAASVASLTHATEIDSEIASPTVKLQHGCCLPFFFCRRS